MRAAGYSIGTDDRTIREYIVTQSRDLKRKRSLRNVYYAIVSSAFSDDYDDMVRQIKMETDVNEVCLMEASSLVAMVEQKLRDPRTVTLGPNGMQRVLSGSGVVTANSVSNLFA
jgi:predicted site-specific integrase-resolvase